MEKLIDEVLRWTEQMLGAYDEKHLRSCLDVGADISGYFSREFLGRCYYVRVEKVPFPSMAEIPSLKTTLPQLPENLEEFIAIDAEGITWKNVYFLKTSAKNAVELHVHELVHALQWKILGPGTFLRYYIYGLMEYGYGYDPLEAMAFTVSGRFARGGEPFDIEGEVRRRLQDMAIHPQDRASTGQ